MDQFYQGIFSAIGMLGGICAFNFWMFSMMEKRIDMKFAHIEETIETVSKEQSDQRKRSDHLYELLFEAIKGHKPKC